MRIVCSEYLLLSHCLPKFFHQSLSGVIRLLIHNVYFTLKILQEYVPSKMSSSRFSLHWINRTVKQMSRQKNRNFDKARRTKKKSDITRYRKSSVFPCLVGNVTTYSRWLSCTSSRNVLLNDKGFWWPEIVTESEFQLMSGRIRSSPNQTTDDLCFLVVSFSAHLIFSMFSLSLLGGL
jgi:hypothetical protein